MWLERSDKSIVQKAVGSTLVKDIINSTLSATTFGVVDTVNNYLVFANKLGLPNFGCEDKVGSCLVDNVNKFGFLTNHEYLDNVRLKVPPLYWNYKAGFDFELLEPRYRQFRERIYREADSRLPDGMYTYINGKLYEFDTETNRMKRVGKE